jgi:hypothetical protein
LSVLLCYNLFNLHIKKSIERFSFIRYILILKNLVYGRNNKCYIIIIYFWGGGINYMSRGTKFLNTGLKVPNWQPYKISWMVFFVWFCWSTTTIIFFYTFAHDILRFSYSSWFFKYSYVIFSNFFWKTTIWFFVGVGYMVGFGLWLAFVVLINI